MSPGLWASYAFPPAATAAALVRGHGSRWPPSLQALPMHPRHPTPALQGSGQGHTQRHREALHTHTPHPRDTVTGRQLHDFYLWYLCFVLKISSPPAPDSGWGGGSKK